jgi:hypothetical protein
MTQQLSSEITKRITRRLKDDSGFLQFESLEGSSTALSNVYQCIANGSLFGLVSACVANEVTTKRVKVAAELAAMTLFNLREQGLRAIQVRGYFHDCERSDYDVFFFVLPEAAGCVSKQFGQLLMTAARASGKQPLAVTTKPNQICLMECDGRIVKCYTRRTFEPHHLRRICAAMTGNEYSHLETGFLKASPTFIAGRLFAEAGLLSDIPLHLQAGAFGKLHARGLLRLQ